jgi:hypothetical protein
MVPISRQNITARFGCQVQWESTICLHLLEMIGSSRNRGLLAAMHCHDEGKVKVQLNSEYALTTKLVEAETAVASDKDL